MIRRPWTSLPLPEPWKLDKRITYFLIHSRVDVESPFGDSSETRGAIENERNGSYRCCVESRSCGIAGEINIVIPWFHLEIERSVYIDRIYAEIESPLIRENMHKQMEVFEVERLNDRRCTQTFLSIDTLELDRIARRTYPTSTYLLD